MKIQRENCIKYNRIEYEKYTKKSKKKFTRNV